MSLSAAEILATPASEPERVFTRDGYVKEHRALAKQWHPDVSKHPDADKLFAHINALKDAAKQKDADGSWMVPGVIEIKLRSGSTARLKYKRKIDFELGTMFYSANTVAFLIKPEFKDIARDGADMLTRLSFRDQRMADEMTKYLPDFSEIRNTDGDGLFYLAKKTPDVFLLEDVRRALGGKIDPKHVAWIMSGIYNIACYLEYANLTHNGMTSETFFVSPKFHSTLLLGGWWYVVSRGDRLAAMPDGTKRFAPADMLKTKASDPRVDLASIKDIGRLLLGDRTGMTLLLSGVPAPMVTFLRSPSSGSARKDYASWVSALEASFGPRRFTEMKIAENDIYNL